MRVYITAIVILIFTGTLKAQDETSPGFSDYVPYVPTPKEVMEVIFELAEIKDGDVLYDLGSGDGRIPIEASVRYGIRSVGVEIDDELVRRARVGAERKGVEELVTIIQGDLFQQDFSDATVLVLYLFPDINEKLLPKIQQLPAGTRIISHRFPIGDWTPDQTRKVEMEDGRVHEVFFWIVR
ncbi:class I SAM-dependent methyltransferase [Litoribacter ruber]|uniref:Class I SAM-dependent methyltransferase n=1 Tax=Litoribacter ruber TaxID=702568 RepID=A0AAP2CP07_9BACT|nr:MULTISPECIES: methyltransferase domain-containing protein [Litoribacter]MBS9525252.1 class I SAM-dependent methyltransferase [Litoribacter alkaliphilus]MBT0810133.1 class I SAM-dependent methyltransferase [Litoribacter ruber]